jgi:hypothetical protein
MEDTLKRALAVGCICAGVALTGVTAGVADQGGTPNARSVAAKACKDERKEVGREAFKATYGKHAMRNCIRETTPDAEDAIKNAAKECKAERAEDPEAFRTNYGANENGKNAFGKCVSQTAREDLDDDNEETPPTE